MGHPDAELIGRWQKGDTSAFEELVRRWQQPIGRFLARHVGQTDLVHDLSQEVFLRLYLARTRYRENGVFSTWLYQIALNVARDALRKRRFPVEPLCDREPVANGTPVGELCEQGELNRTLTDCLAELPEALREVLVLRHYEGLNFEQISILLRVPASTLKSRFSAAVVRLRKRLEELGWQEAPEERAP
ncbi:MAG: RNA polymerase sigma factor [Gemmataceae bacterium]